MAYTLKLDAREFLGNIKHLDDKTQAALKVVGDTVSNQMESYAKLNAPWTDRTSNARQGLKGRSVAKDDVTILEMSIAHTMDYGLWLETRLAFQDRYKILEDARDSQVDTLKTMLKGLKL